MAVGLVLALLPTAGAFPGANGKIAFSSSRSGNFDIWRMDGSGGSLLQLTTDGADDVDPAVSADGRTVVFSRSGDLITVPLAGGGEAGVLDDGNQNVQPFWAPDGTRIAFIRDPGGASELRILTLGGGVSDALASGASEPAWSPDGSKIA